MFWNDYLISNLHEARYQWFFFFFSASIIRKLVYYGDYFHKKDLNHYSTIIGWHLFNFLFIDHQREANLQTFQFVQHFFQLILWSK